MTVQHSDSLSEGPPKIFQRLFIFARWIGALAFIAMFIAFIAGVFMRYVAERPIQWSDEFISITAIWIVFWMSAFVIRDREHVRVDFIFTRLGPHGRRIMTLFSALFFGSVFATALPSVVDYLLFLGTKHTDILEWRLSIVFMCLPMFFAAIVLRSIRAVFSMLSPSWREHVADPPTNAKSSGAGP